MTTHSMAEKSTIYLTYDSEKKPMRVIQSQHRCLVHEVLHSFPGFWLPTFLSEVGQHSIYEQWLNPSRLSHAPVHLEPELLLPGAVPVAPGNLF